jgi:uncharacterized protein (DUF488 family)
MTIFTIGYEGLEINGFMSLLHKHNIQKVVDIRELPLSRKPGFSKKSLANVLILAGIEYQHMAELGCPRPVRDRYRLDGNWKRYTEGFLSYLQTQDTAISVLSAMVEQSNCALLCYEANPSLCHRSMVANAVNKHCGTGIRHIKKAEYIKTRILESPQLVVA